MFSNIILVCTGNICRSPMAEAIMSRALLAHNQSDGKMRVSSAGVAALPNFPADPLARLVMEEHGYDISGHHAQQAKPEILSKCDLILTLDQTHSDWIRARFPELQGRTHKLGRWKKNMDVEDPYRKAKAKFEQAYAEISECAEEWVRRIKML